MNHHDITLQHNGIRLGIRDYGGEGVPLLLLHGGTRNVADWDEIAALLLKHHRVVALDVRSHGHSTPCGDVWRFEDAVKDVEAVIDYLQLDNPFVAGHSLGGLIAILYGARHPNCRGVIDIDGVGVSVPPHFPEPDGAAAQQRVRAMIAMMIDAADVPSPSVPIFLNAEEVEARITSVQSSERAVVFTRRSFFPHPDGTYEENPSALAQSAFSHALLDYDLFTVLPTVQCPLLFIAAIEELNSTLYQDDFTTTMHLWRVAIKTAFETMRHTHPNLLYTSIIGDHMLVPNNPTAVAEALLAFTH